MTSEYRQSLTELNTIFQYMNSEYIKLLPKKFINFVTENMDKDYNPNIASNVPINKQDLKKDTRVLLSLIYRNYWCTQEEKERLINKDLEDKEQYEKEQREKYNPDNIFKNKSKISENNTEIENEERHVQIAEYKEPKWYQKIFDKILKIFKIKK